MTMWILLLGILTLVAGCVLLALYTEGWLLEFLMPRVV
jgi:hypothetical protein